MNKVIVSILFIVTMMTNSTKAQVFSGVWRCDFDSVIMGMKVTYTSYYIFNSDNKVFQFNVDRENKPKLFCYTLINKPKNNFIMRYERKLSDLYNNEDTINTIYSNYYSTDLYDTINIQNFTMTHFSIKNEVLGISHLYTKISDNDFLVSPNVFSSIYNTQSQIEVSITENNLKNARNQLSSLFDTWLLKDEILFSYFIEDEKLFNYLKESNIDEVNNLITRELVSKNKYILKKYLLCLMYLNSRDSDIINLNKQINSI